MSKARKVPATLKGPGLLHVCSSVGTVGRYTTMQGTTESIHVIRNYILAGSGAAARQT
jgi:hypothetical protein